MRITNKMILFMATIMVVISCINNDNKNNEIRTNNKIIVQKAYKNQLSDSIVEYVNIGKKMYVNQIWILNKEGDTLYGKGNYLNVKIPDSVKAKKIIECRFFLQEPLFSDTSKTYVLLPKKGSILKKDFSNWNQINFDTIPSLKNDNIPHPELPSKFPENRYVAFGMEFDRIGIEKVRGVFVEEIINSNNNIEQRRIFFERIIYVY